MKRLMNNSTVVVMQTCFSPSPRPSPWGRGRILGSLSAYGACLCIGMLMPLATFALIVTGHGNDPVRDAGWPEGALAVANLKTRVGWGEGPPFGGGKWQFLYRGDTEAFQQALTTFAAMRAPKLDLFIQDGPQENSILKERTDWTFTVWNPASWYRLYNNPRSVFSADQPNFRQPVAPPRLDVYLGGGQVNWAKVNLPANVTVHDERASAAGVDLSGGSVIQAGFFDMATGKPVCGARLLVERVSWQSTPEPHWDSARLAEAVSDVSGRVRLEKILADTIRVSVSADGYASRRLVHRPLARPTLLKFSVELAKAASVRGTMTDTEGKPIKGANVRPVEILGLNGLGYDNGLHYESYEKSVMVTDEAGLFEIGGLPTGFIQLGARAPGYYFGDIFTIHDVPATNILLRMARAGSIRILVTDKNGRAMAKFDGHELLVNIEPKGGSRAGSWGGSRTVKEDGTVEFFDVPAGEYFLTSRPNPATAKKQYAPEQIIKLEPGMRANVKVVYE